jgi:hypothetical protein
MRRAKAALGQNGPSKSKKAEQESKTSAGMIRGSYRQGCGLRRRLPPAHRL